MERSESEALLDLDAGGERCYCDPVLLRDGRVYGRFIRDMHQRGLVRFLLGARERVGIFFVRRKNGALSGPRQSK